MIISEEFLHLKVIGDSMKLKDNLDFDSRPNLQCKLNYHY